MYSYKHFSPGSSTKTSSNSRRIIQYLSLLPPGKSVKCICNTDDDNKVKKDATDVNATNISNLQRISNVIQTQGFGGSVRIGGNAYLGETVGGQISIVNYLGKLEGQSGGSGVPLRNKF